LIQAQAFNGLFEGDPATVRAVSTEGVRISRETGDLYRLTMMLVNRGVADLSDSALGESRPFLVEALRCAREIDDRATQAHVLETLGCLAAGSGQAATAGRLLGAAETIRTGAGARRLPFMAPLVDRARKAAIATLGVARFEAEFATGGALNREDAIRLALADGPRTAAGSAEAAGVLGKREMEVARLVAEGLTNKEIGARLFISESTVATHVRAILNKLGFNSRAQIAGWSANAR
ncbi:MAG: response regulator transcription factor, partial [Candidatus Dormibacteraeota bacterium]|nr:response regulator transcription factor [Candidatus Dormibacteraeota bacterium]